MSKVVTVGATALFACAAVLASSVTLRLAQEFTRGITMRKSSLTLLAAVIGLAGVRHRPLIFQTRSTCRRRHRQ